MNKATEPPPWFGYSIVLQFNFGSDPRTGVCDLLIRLAQHEAPGSRTISILFEGVAGLSVKDFGGGLTQLLCLAVEDIRDQQLDRINYVVTDKERDALKLSCRAFRIVEEGLVS